MYKNPPDSRADEAAMFLSGLAADAGQEVRLGNKEELRTRCGVSVGTFNEALKLAQASGSITLRRGPGGGIFAARQSALQIMARSILSLGDPSPSTSGVRRLHSALYPLVIEDALTHSSTADLATLREHTHQAQAALTSHDLPGAWRACHQFEVSLAGISSDSLLRAIFTGLVRLLEENITWPHPHDEKSLALQAQQLAHQIQLTSALEARDRATALLFKPL